MKKVGFIILVGLICVAINWLSLALSWWWVTPAVGLVIGLLIRGAGTSFLLSLCIGALSWGLPLALLATNAPVVRVANAVESMIGLSATGGILIIVLTVVLACVLSVVGTWVGVTGRKIISYP